MFTDKDVIDFYNGTYNPTVPYNIEDIVNANFGFWEGCHNFIQWVFPLMEPSNHNPDAPIITDPETYFHLNKNNVVQAVEKFCSFLGIVVYVENYDQYIHTLHYPRIQEWWVDGNHNLLRITRLLKFLKHSKMYYEFNHLKSLLDTIAKRIGKLEAQKYWDAV